MEQLTTDWKEVILNYPQIDGIFKKLENERTLYSKTCDIFPSKNNIFRCFNYFDVKNTRIVILGQDPYHNKNQACGLCFGVNKEIKTPPSLRSIQQELINDIGKDLKSKTLEYWAQQGILLMNTALTVVEHIPTSHMKIWLPFTKYIIDYINEHCEKVVFVAWGSFAYDKLKEIDQNKHTLLVSSHPSPLSCRRKFSNFPSFIGSKPFSNINKILEKKINW